MFGTFTCERWGRASWNFCVKREGWEAEVIDLVLWKLTQLWNRAILVRWLEHRLKKGLPGRALKIHGWKVNVCIAPYLIFILSTVLRNTNKPTSASYLVPFLSSYPLRPHLSRFQTLAWGLRCLYVVFKVTKDIHLPTTKWNHEASVSFRKYGDGGPRGRHVFRSLSGFCVYEERKEVQGFCCDILAADQRDGSVCTVPRKRSRRDRVR